MRNHVYCTRHPFLPVTPKAPKIIFLTDFQSSVTSFLINLEKKYKQFQNGRDLDLPAPISAMHHGYTSICHTTTLVFWKWKNQPKTKVPKIQQINFSEEAFPTIYGHVTYVSSQSHAPSYVGCLFVNNGTCLFLFSRSYFPVQPACPSNKLRWLMEFSG